MRAHLAYLRYIVRHKWFVFLECCRLGIPWLGVIHDWSKFRLSEWVAYVRYFYGDWPPIREAWRQCPGYCGPTKESVQAAFDAAWLYHQHRNKHHWQYWLLVQDEDEDKILMMPLRYAKEMLADWRGAGRALGNPDTRAWYLEHRGKMRLHHMVRDWIERELEVR